MRYKSGSPPLRGTPGGSRVENELVKLKKSIYYQRNKDVTAAWANAISLYCFTFKF